MSDHDPTISAARGAARSGTGFARAPKARESDTGFARAPEARESNTGFARAPKARESDTGYARGVAAEEHACAALSRAGFTILGRRMRTACGEIDVVAASAALLVFVEVKRRRDLDTAALSLGARQRSRLLAAAEILLADHPEWAREGIRFDVVLVDAAGRVRLVADAFRQEG